jgi:hypothetical protein
LRGLVAVASARISASPDCHEAVRQEAAKAIISDRAHDGTLPRLSARRQFHMS